MSQLWGSENLCLSPRQSSKNWGGESGELGGTRTFGHPVSPLRNFSQRPLADLDMWDSNSHFKSQFTAWSAASLTKGFSSKISTGTFGSGIDGVFDRQNDPGLGERRWQSDSRMHDQGVLRSHSPVLTGAELRAALEDGSFRRAELVQRLREANGNLDSKTDLMKIREATLQPGTSSAQILDLKHKGKQTTDRELSRLRRAVREAEEKAEALETDRERVLQQLRSSKEVQRTVLSQTEEVNQKLDRSMQTNKETQEQLSEARIKLSQAALERDLMTTEVMKLEESVEDLKVKLTGAMLGKDHLLQDKVDLNQRAQDLELLLEWAQSGSKGYTNQVFELSNQLAESRDQANRQGQETARMKEELLTVKEINEKMTAELEMTKKSLESSLARINELGAERVLHTNQITALKTERLQLIGQHEELLSAIGQDAREKAELTELREKCGLLSESKDTLESENQRLHDHCLTLEAELLEKEEEQHWLEAESARTTEQLRAVATHWSEKWQDVAMALQTTQAELKELRETTPPDTLQEVTAELKVEVQRLHTEGQKDKEEIQTLRQLKANTEAELNRVRKDGGSLLRVELDACKQQLELERCRSLSVHNRLKGGRAVQTHDEGTETDCILSSHKQAAQVSVEEMAQVRAELQKVCDILRFRDTELEEQQQELDEARRQVSQQNSELQRLELEATKRERELGDREHALSRLERLRVAERTEAKIKISTLKLELIKQKELAGEGSPQEVQHTDIQRTQLEDCSQRACQLQVSTDQAVEGPQTLHQIQGREDDAAVSRKEKTVSLENISDQDEQMSLVTEQLKSLFKERDQATQVCDTSPGRAGAVNSEGGKGRSFQDVPPMSKVTKNSLDTLLSQRKRERELREKEWRLGAGLRAVSEEQEEEQEEQQREVEDKEVSILEEEQEEQQREVEDKEVSILEEEQEEQQREVEDKEVSILEEEQEEQQREVEDKEVSILEEELK
ncbi:hypothetical protein DPEC_G00160380 [Dallia pectoralis]|uniref:Uncharacterized protein n=1 Tax=Dallia pectoralis TaxID=75939 RepID=A0ACC2GGB6_DALPE|nr:hypothetical protein DPEC_G00160380 [Dallia pectoralis]